ncbi:hypothetical protein FH972_020815 [Carpinus fangiana]|nr:hypothetical protein FH972_020815 [Carpinus fangiana]
MLEVSKLNHDPPKVFLVSCFSFLTFFFMIPYALVQSLASLEGIEKAAPFLKPVIEKPFVNSLITGFLLGIVLKLFLTASHIDDHHNYWKCIRTARFIYSPISKREFTARPDIADDCFLLADDFFCWHQSAFAAVMEVEQSRFLKALSDATSGFDIGSQTVPIEEISDVCRHNRTVQEIVQGALRRLQLNLIPVS